MSFNIFRKLAAKQVPQVSKQIVIARHREPVYKWLLLVPSDVNKKLYLKHGDGSDLIPNVLDYVDETEVLKNVGREGHTYLHHIISNYPNFADITAFVQGDPTYHGHRLALPAYFKLDTPGEKSSFSLSSKRRSYNLTFLFETPEDFYKEVSGSYKTVEVPVYSFQDWWEKYLTPYGIDFPDSKTFQFSCGACFSVRKEYILKYPIEFYVDLQKSVSTFDPFEGHYLERAWPYIFYDKANYKR